MNRIDFVVVFSVKDANPNGDPLDGNRPRQLSDGRGEVSDVCIKRKIRNRLDVLGEKVLVKTTEKCLADGEPSTVADRYIAEVNGGKKMKELTPADIAKGAQAFIDIRMFGQVYSFLGDKISGNTRGAVSITNAVSADPIVINEMQITKSISNADAAKKGSDTMGMQYSADFGFYMFFGSISGRVAKENGMTQHDVDLLKEALETLFVDDESTARPVSSMNVERVVWYEHSSLNGQYRPDEVRDSVHIEKKEGVDVPQSAADYVIVVDELPKLEDKGSIRPWFE